MFFSFLAYIGFKFLWLIFLNLVSAAVGIVESYRIENDKLLWQKERQEGIKRLIQC